MHKKRSISSNMSYLFLLFFSWISFGYAEPGNEYVDVVAHNIEIEGEDLLSLSYRNQDGWHTYWKNPGDSGLATKFSFKFNDQDIQLESKEWPTPKRYIEAGDIWTFGYSNDYSFFFEIPEEIIGKKGELEIASQWLVCKDICIPGQIKKTIQWNGRSFQKEESPAFKMLPEILAKRYKALPQNKKFPQQLDMVLAKDPQRENGLVLYTNISNMGHEKLMPNMNVLTPFTTRPLEFQREELYQDTNNNLYIRTPIDWDGIYQTPPQSLREDGEFDKPLEFKFLYANPFENKVQVIQKTFDGFSLEAGNRLDKFKEMLTPVGDWTDSNDDHSKGKIAVNETITDKSMESTDRSTLMLLLFAFIGGFILNLMPCVLPVISIKIFGLLQHGHESRGRVLKHNLSYTLGILVSFWVIAAIVVAFKSAGETIGWGFQLQSPSFVAIMCLVIFALALNMFGLFEFSTPGGSKLGGVQLKDGFIGDFFSGVLATILSTPCSAPFLGTALTFAFTSPPQIIFLVLSFVGLGLATPFILTGIFPKLVSFLPKPGLWMDHVKKFLGFTLILTCLWLLDVYGALISGSLNVLRLQTALAVLFLFFYMRTKITRKLIYVVPVCLVFIYLAIPSINVKTGSSTGNNSALLQDKIDEGLAWEKWSTEKMQEHADNKELVFIDFTAKWCMTCKVNERFVINTDHFKEIVKKYNVKLLLADWTKRDAYIGNWLKSQGMVGVPAYFVQKPDGTLIKLGETISFDRLEKHFKD
jgi:thiol:disulfide interchange protein DsbD